MKQCSRCGEVKLLSKFGRKNWTLQKEIRTPCRECRNSCARERRKLPGARERERAIKVKYRNSEKGKATHYRYRQTEKWKEIARKINAAEYSKESRRNYEYSQRGREVRSAIKARRRALEAIDCSLTLVEWEKIKSAYEYACAYCGIVSSELTRDHIVPLTKGGHHIKDNIVPACRPCNSRKGNRLNWGGANYVG